jgi:hypothetical protein
MISRVKSVSRSAIDRLSPHEAHAIARLAIAICRHATVYFPQIRGPLWKFNFCHIALHQPNYTPIRIGRSFSSRAQSNVVNMAVI